MLIPKMRLGAKEQQLIRDALPRGWMLEPQAKELLRSWGFDLPRGIVTDSVEAAAAFQETVTGDVVLKAVSEKILHKTEHQAVVTHVRDRDTLETQMHRLLTLEGCASVLVEEMVDPGVEIFLGAKNDLQFGPVVILGLGGTAVEIYNDTAIRMAPVTEGQVGVMVRALKGAALLKGYRGGAAVNMKVLGQMVAAFSHLAMAMEPNLHSIDLNPVICTRDRCVAVDARIMLSESC